MEVVQYSVLGTTGEQVLDAAIYPALPPDLQIKKLRVHSQLAAKSTITVAP